MIKPKKTPEEIAAARARKVARREKQRATNTLRAAKMHAYLLANKKHQPRPEPTQTLYVGCSGWFYWDWRGIFYPEDSKPNEWFAHYARHFNTVELNAPFYSWPTIATVQSWLKQATKKNFIYTIKVSELITHIKSFTGTKQLIKDFSVIADILNERMGCFLFQFPPSFSYTPLRLKKILAQLPYDQRNVVEFRHASWWNESVYAAFRKQNIIFCATSGPKLPDELICTAEDIYIRFHGKAKWYRYDYSKQEIAVWVKRIHASGAKRIWVYFNNDYEGHAIKNAKELVRQLKSIQQH